MLSARLHMEVVHISYIMCTRGLPDIYTLSSWACAPRALGVYTRQTTRAHGITTKYMEQFYVTYSAYTVQFLPIYLLPNPALTLILWPVLANANAKS